MDNLDAILPVIVWVVIILVGIFFNKKKPEEAKKIETGKKPQEFAGMLQYLERLNRGEGYSQEGASKEIAQKNPKSSEKTTYTYQNQEAKALEKKKKKKIEEQAKELSASLSIKSTKPPKPEKPKKTEKESEEDYKAYHQRVRTNAMKQLFEDKDQVRNAFIMSEIMKRKF